MSSRGYEKVQFRSQKVWEMKDLWMTIFMPNINTIVLVDS